MFKPWASLLGRLKAGEPEDAPKAEDAPEDAEGVRAEPVGAVAAGASVLREVNAGDGDVGEDGAVTATLGLVAVVLAAVATGVVVTLGVGVTIACAAGCVWLTGDNTISIAMLLGLSRCGACGDRNKAPMTNTCKATTHSTTVGAVRGLSACDGA